MLSDNTKIMIGNPQLGPGCPVNHGIFSQIDNRYTFGIISFKNTGSTDRVAGKFERGNIEILRDIDEESIELTREILHSYSPYARIFPYIRSVSTSTLTDSISQRRARRSRFLCLRTDHQSRTKLVAPVNNDPVIAPIATKSSPGYCSRTMGN